MKRGNNLFLGALVVLLTIVIVGLNYVNIDENITGSVIDVPTIQGYYDYGGDYIYQGVSVQANGKIWVYDDTNADGVIDGYWITLKDEWLYITNWYINPNSNFYVYPDSKWSYADNILVYSTDSYIQGKSIKGKWMTLKGVWFYDLKVEIGDYKYENDEGYVYTAAGTGRVGLCRYYSSSSKDHLYQKCDGGESSTTVITGTDYKFEWTEGYVYTAAGTGRVGLCRYYSSSSKDHLYQKCTGTESSTTVITGTDYKFEAIEGYVETTQKTGTKPLGRFYNSIAKDHLYQITDGNYKSGDYLGNPSGTATTPPSPVTTCKADSDGESITTQGFVTLTDNTKVYDACKDTTKVNEQTCPATKIITIKEIACPTGQSCSIGRCIETSATVIGPGTTSTELPQQNIINSINIGNTEIRSKTLKVISGNVYSNKESKFYSLNNGDIITAGYWYFGEGTYLQDYPNSLNVGITKNWTYMDKTIIKRGATTIATFNEDWIFIDSLVLEELPTATSSTGIEFNVQEVAGGEWVVLKELYDKTAWIDSGNITIKDSFVIKNNTNGSISNSAYQFITMNKKWLFIKNLTNFPASSQMYLLNKSLVGNWSYLNIVGNISAFEVELYDPITNISYYNNDAKGMNVTIDTTWWFLNNGRRVTAGSTPPIDPPAPPVAKTKEDVRLLKLQIEDRIYYLNNNISNLTNKWIINFVKSEVNTTVFDEEKTGITSGFETKADSEMASIFTKLVSLKNIIPIKTTETKAFFKWNEVIDGINVEIIEEISSLTPSTTTSAITKIDDYNSNVKGNVTSTEIIAELDTENNTVLTIYKIQVEKKSSTNKEYLIMDVPTAVIISRENYNIGETDSGSYFNLSSGLNTFEILLIGEQSADELGLYVSPTIQNLGIGGGNNPTEEECVSDIDCLNDETCELGECVPVDDPLPVDECERDSQCNDDETCEFGECVPADEPENTGLIIMIIVLVIGIIGAIVGIMYYINKKGSGSSNLFKNPMDLTNLINFIRNAKKTGMSSNDIINRLLSRGWTHKQIDYAFKKAGV